MRHIYLLLVLISLLMTSGCTALFYDRFHEYEDEFTGSKKNIVRMEVNTQERRTEIDYANITFESVFFETGQVVKVYFVVKRDTESFKADNHAFLKIDNILYKTDLDQVNMELQTKVDSSTSSLTSTDSTGTTTTNIYSNSTYSWIDEKFAFRLNGEMISSLKSANSFLIRIYFGPIPATFRINESNLNLIKKAIKE